MMSHESEYYAGTITDNKTGKTIKFIYHESVANLVNYVVNGFLKLQSDLTFDDEAEYNEVFDIEEEDTEVSKQLGRVRLDKEGLEGKIKLVKGDN